MTSKELLYVDDAIGHISHFQVICDEYSKKIKNQELKAFVSDLSSRSKEMKSRLMDLLGGATNER